MKKQIFAKVNQFGAKATEYAGTLDANYWKGLLSSQERTGVYEEIYRSEHGGGVQLI